MDGQKALMSLLTTAQKAQFKMKQAIVVYGSASHHRYVISKKRAIMRDHSFYGANGFCVYIRNDNYGNTRRSVRSSARSSAFDCYDYMITMMLLIGSNEQHFLKVANPTYYISDRTRRLISNHTFMRYSPPWAERYAQRKRTIWRCVADGVQARSAHRCPRCGRFCKKERA